MVGVPTVVESQGFGLIRICVMDVWERWTEIISVVPRGVGLPVVLLTLHLHSSPLAILDSDFGLFKLVLTGRKCGLK